MLGLMNDPLQNHQHDKNAFFLESQEERGRFRFVRILRILDGNWGFVLVMDTTSFKKTATSTRTSVDKQWLTSMHSFLSFSSNQKKKSQLEKWYTDFSPTGPQKMPLSIKNLHMWDTLAFLLINMET
jgi:hypothetical protein